nr:hypothetical protein [Tanacetum cinerariifolium]
MATTIEQQVALDEAFVPSSKGLRIGRSNFRLPSDIQSKESTLQVATTYVHQHSIRLKIDIRKNIFDLEAFREMLHISPRVPGQSFIELPFEEEILEFLWFLGHSAQITTLTDVNVTKLFQPWRSFAAGLYHRRNVDYDFLIWEDFVYQEEHKNQKKSNEMNIKAYKEYYACATGEATPKPKASARRKRGGSDSSTTPPTAVASPRPITTVAAAPRLTAAAKGKQPARATSPTDPLEHGGSSTDEGTGSKPGVP